MKDNRIPNYLLRDLSALPKQLRDHWLETFLRELYTESFPLEERRPWSEFCQLLDAEPRFAVYLLCLPPVRPQELPRPVAFFTLWQIADSHYVEHLTVQPHYRGAGLGLDCVKQLIGRFPRLFLEVEPASLSDEAARRIGFYQRAGLLLSGLQYMQPPYRAGYRPIELSLMRSPGLSEGELARLIPQMQEIVYGHAPSFDA